MSDRPNKYLIALNTIDFKISNGRVVDSAQNPDYRWQHYDLSDEASLAALRKNKQIPEFALMGLISRETRPRIEIHEEAMLIILRGANLNDDASDDDMISLRILAHQDHLITAQFRELKTTRDFLQRTANGKAEKSVSELLAKMISALFERIEISVMSLSDKVDQLEETLDTSELQTSREQIADLRRQVVVFKRHLLPQREVASLLRYSKLDWVEDAHSTLHNENYERIMRNIDELEEMRDKLTIIKEEVQTIQSERLNRNTYVLSVVAAIFLPLGFLTGLLGINIAGMPGADYPLAFWIFCVLLIIIVIIQIFIMRRNKWF